MSKTHDFMDKQLHLIYQGLTTFGLPVYEDEIAPDEEKSLLDDYHCLVYETGPMSKNRDMKTVSQVLTVYYYCENRDDIDKRTIDIVDALDNVPRLEFIRTQKQRLQKKDTDQFVDRVILTFARVIPYGKC
ncbi:hypothetical protein CSV63_07430 [Sporosarcina sp. P34]|uniref:hypothetical protein n=1 Tax=Sporosarcina sp. P34 TaxID=2048247 RepID=UPI000C16C124|nr:hypothetical protein [Sporosarcina sp. P34]PID15601.1 hypothetical protein CSV63_07430 [Sporosarcina sp. P34]